MDNLVEISNVHFSRNGRQIFQGIDLSIPKGKITAIMGPSGTGKTTLLRLIGAELYPDTGSVTVADQNIHNLSRGDLYSLRKQMGLLFQSSGLFTHLNVFENVAFPLREHTNLTKNMIADLVLLKLEMVGLRGAKNLMPSELSGGMARRVGLARAIALDPELIMYDEPLAGQDPITKGIILKLIKTLNESLGLTTVVVSHDIQDILEIADHSYILSDGKIIGSGTSSEIIENPSNKVQQFLHGQPDGPVPFHFPSINLEKDLTEGIK